MNINKEIKKATNLAKEKKFEDAINLLKVVIKEMAKIGGFQGSYTKIIPYFQKAGLYEEGIVYSETILIKSIKEDLLKTYAHQSKDVREAFYQLGLSEVYSKLYLISKREKDLLRMSKYEKLGNAAYNEYLRLYK